MQEQCFESGIDFSERFRNYHPKAKTLVNKEILDLIGVDPCFKAISDFIVGEYPSIRNQNTKVLVLGSGSGELPKYLFQTFPNTEIYGLDIAIDVFRRLRQLNSQDSFICSDARKLPLVDKSFDVVVAHGVFRYISEPLSAIAEIDRVLKPKGMAFVSEGKDIATMSDCFSEIINAEKCISSTPLPFRIDNIPMPRLTLFYALVENCKKEPEIMSRLEKATEKEKSLTNIQILFQMAGMSIDYIFGIEWIKSF